MSSLSIARISRRTSVTSVGGGTRVLAKTAMDALEDCRNGRYTTGSIVCRMRSFCAMFPTTPTTVIHSSDAPARRRRLPSARSPGHVLLANRSLTTTTGADAAPSNNVNSRPSTIRGAQSGEVRRTRHQRRDGRALLVVDRGAGGRHAGHFVCHAAETIGGNRISQRD